MDEIIKWMMFVLDFDGWFYKGMADDNDSNVEEEKRDFLVTIGHANVKMDDNVVVNIELGDQNNYNNSCVENYLWKPKVSEVKEINYEGLLQIKQRKFNWNCT